MNSLIVLVTFLNILSIPPVFGSEESWLEVVVKDANLKLPEGTSRLLIAFASGGGRPRFTDASFPGQPVFGMTLNKIELNKPVSVDTSAVGFPIGTDLNDLPPGQYKVQAVLAFNPSINLPTAIGNLRSEVVDITVPFPKDTKVTIPLTQAFEARSNREREGYEQVEIPSPLLTAFHNRPMTLRFGVALPAEREAANNDGQQIFQSNTKGLIVHIGGFGQRSSSVVGLERDPRFVQILLDGAGPFGDPYYVDSANNGPYGRALLEEIIPFVEQKYQCAGSGKFRFTTGGSTGGWVSLALQILYPDEFNGCWSSCPDGVDFRNFQLINIYEDENAFFQRDGAEVPAKRNRNGQTDYSVRHECQLEQVLGGGRWELGGQQWASWNAVYGPKGPKGPVPLWDGVSGKINSDVADTWKRYDLRMLLQDNWSNLGSRVNGKIHVWVGDRDEYFLNLAVERFHIMTQALTNPKFDGQIIIEPGKGHTSGWKPSDIRDAMYQRMIHASGQ
ncbi:MAG: alpha/beta hydrolase-fold protein [Pirellula sp.]